MHPTVEAYISHAVSFCPGLSSEAIGFLAAGLSISSYNRKDLYLPAGAVHTHIGFVGSGLIRTFYTDDRGNEITVRFAAEGSYVTHYAAFLQQAVSPYTCQCLEKSEVVNLSFAHMQACYQRFPETERLGRLIAEQVLVAQNSRIEAFLFSNAEQRYLHFIQSQPGLFQRVSLSFLASYLGIERPSLSRIRKKLAGQNRPSL